MAAQAYTRLQVRLHWAVVILVALQYLLHDGISDAFDAGMESGAFVIDVAAGGHMAVGALILLLAFWRLSLRQETAPPPPASDPPWQRMAARLAHGGFYILLILLPISGAIAWGSRSPGAAEVHGAMRAVLLFLIVLHVAGALYGQFVQKTGVLSRMLRGV